ncbi:MAG: hypothetical protein QOH05_516 [Acetobacteraceae bacterium]|nr:hypothetical protein [Acetobacteraceae bacterium]
MATSLTPAGSVGARAVAPNLSLRDLMFCFEGFGDNCEFGFIQRRLGAEPLGLFRFAWLGLPEIVEALQTGFAALDTPENVEVYLHENDEYFVRFNTSSYYHTFIFSGQEEQEAVRRKQLIRISLLRRNLIETLEQGTKIIVRKGQGPATLQEPPA